ncbi:hypothetical protein IFM89_037475 [Coptis chinensis]|uniref:Early light-induced protein n=1 Tax=Coptis chinensis TaxID=261450 RepID=A0A835LSY3_9MAGN|nr:hypothetical protein IFM89_037475 [Coptis chinensis]
MGPFSPACTVPFSTYFSALLNCILQLVKFSTHGITNKCAIPGQEMHSKEYKLSYDAYFKALTVLKVVTHLMLVVWFWGDPVAAVSKQLLQPFGKVLSWGAGDLDNDHIMDQKPETSTPIEMPTTAPQTPPPAPKASRRLSDLMAFSGAAPERINGRLAMIGFVSAIAAELTIGDDVVAQLANGGFGLFVGTTVLLSMASLVPLIKGVSVESKSNGVMTSDAEMWNGRFAMLGLVALVFTEFVKGGALV